MGSTYSLTGPALLNVKAFLSSRRNILELRWLQELLVVSTLFILFTLNEWTYISNWNDLWKGISYFGILYAHAQVHRFALLPILLDKHKPLSYALYSILLLLVFSAILHVVSVYWLYPNCFLYKSPAQDTFVFHVATSALTLIAMLTPFLVLRFYRQQKNDTMSRLCVNEMELNLLRSQLNPHFMFNMFNNLYGISLKEPERMPDLILQVSQLMRYQVENNKRMWVSLADELAFIESYIALEEERVSRRCKISYEFANTCEQAQYQIAPMILIPFIENAFKHGTDSMESCYVCICIQVSDHCLQMEIVNSIPKNASAKISTGIGLQNARQRLNILYPGKHRLQIAERDAEYSVKLALPLYLKEQLNEREIPVSDCR